MPAPTNGFKADSRTTSRPSRAAAMLSPRWRLSSGLYGAFDMAYARPSATCFATARASRTGTALPSCRIDSVHDP